MRADDAELRLILAGLKGIAGAQVGHTSVNMRKLGFQPDKVPYVSTETKAAANVKRQETRRLRGIVSRKKKGR